MDKIIFVDENKQHKVSEVICLNCLKRWIAVRPSQTKLIDLECGKCGQIRSIIETGETFD